MKLIRAIFLITLLTSTISFTEKEGCAIMHQGKFRYMADDEEIIVEIKDSLLTEYHKAGTIKTRIDWINNCEYNITVLKVNLPSFPLGPGDEMNVRINRVEGKDIYYTARVKAVTWDGSFTKLSD